MRAYRMTRQLGKLERKRRGGNYLVYFRKVFGAQKQNRPPQAPVGKITTSVQVARNRIYFYLDIELIKWAFLLGQENG